MIRFCSIRQLKHNEPEIEISTRAWYSLKFLKVGRPLLAVSCRAGVPDLRQTVPLPVYSEALLGKFQRPDFAAQRLSVTARDPDLVLKHESRVLVTSLPNHIRLQFGPGLAVVGVPNVTPIR